MANLSILNVDALANIYMVANTPSYLFRHYRNNSSVQDFADAHSGEDLVAEIKRVSAISLSERTVDDIAVAYAAVVGLTFKEAPGVKALVENVDLSRILWAERILFLWEPYPTVDLTMEMTSESAAVTSAAVMTVTTQPS